MILSNNRKTALSLILAAIVAVIAMYDTAFHLLLELMHVSFELIEQGLDLLVEHTFHTDRRETQIIVFYIMMAIAGYGVYRLYKLLRSLPRRCHEFKAHLALDWLRLMQALSAYWQALPAIGKAKWLLSFMAGVSAMALWLFM